MIGYHRQATGTLTENTEAIGNKGVQQVTETARLVHLAVQVFQPSNHNISQEPQSHTSDAETQDTSAQHAKQQTCTAPSVEQQIITIKLARNTTTLTTAQQTVPAVKGTTLQQPHPKATQTDCSPLQKQVQQYSLQYQEPRCRMQQTSPQR